MIRTNIKSISVIIVIIGVGLLGMYSLSTTSKKSHKRDTKPQIRIVNTDKLEFGDIQLEIEGNGTIKSQSILNVVSEVSGKIDFAKNNLKDGTFIKKNEIIVKIDSREIENNLYSLRSDFLNSVASLLPDLKVESVELYEKWFGYFSLIDINNNLPKLPEVSNLQEKIKLSTRQVFTKYYSARNQEILLSKYIIKAPFTGYIKSSGVIENSFISRGQQLFEIADVYNLEIAIPLLVSDFNQIELNGATYVDIISDNTNRKLKGKLVRKDPNLNKDSQSITVFVTFLNSLMIPEFLSGNYVHVKIKGKKIKNVATVARHLVDNDSNIYTIENGFLGKEKISIKAVQENDLIIFNDSNKELEIVTTILQKPLVGMAIKSSNNIVNADSTKLSDDSVVIN